MKQAAFIVALLLHVMLLNAQDAEQNRTVGIVSFAASNYSDSMAAKNIYAAVSRILIQTKRFTVIEISEWKKTQAEIDRQKGAAFLEQPIIEKGKSLGAQVLAFGVIKNAEVIRDDPKNYSARIDYEVRFIDVLTGKSIAAASFKGSSSNILDAGAKTSKVIKKLPLSDIIGRENARYVNAAEQGLSILSETNKTETEGKLVDAIESTAAPLNNWIRNTFNLNLCFLKVIESDGKKGVQSVLIEGGEDINMKAGNKLKMVLVTETETPQGKKIRDEEPIADLEIEEVRAQTSKCKVTSGQKRIEEHAQNKNIRILFN
jgi:hypothetical protein